MEGIYIYALDLEATKEPFYQTSTILNTGNAKTCTLNELKKFRNYEFFVIPFYKSVHGKPSNSRTLQTMEDGELTISLDRCECVFWRKIYIAINHRAVDFKNEKCDMNSSPSR